MPTQDSEQQTVQAFKEAQAQESVSMTTQAAESVPRTIKYMDNDTFRRSLNKVFNLHGRLLAKLAE